MMLYPTARIRASLWSARRTACLRAYPLNSPKAMARVLAVTLLADGLLESRELDNLARANAYARLGMTQGEFMQVLFEFAEDLLTRAPRSSEGDCVLEPGLFEMLLSEVSEPWRRRELVRLMIEIIRADGRVTRGESVMFWEALDAWGMTLADVVPGSGALPTDDSAKAAPPAQGVGLPQRPRARPALARAPARCTGL
jgi:hypothetical protein